MGIRKNIIRKVSAASNYKRNDHCGKYDALARQFNDDVNLFRYRQSLKIGKDIREIRSVVLVAMAVNTNPTMAGPIFIPERLPNLLSIATGID